MPDSFSGRHEKLNLSGSDSPPHGNRRLEATAEAKLASHADVLTGPPRVPAPQTSDETRGKNVDQSQHTSRSGKCTLDLEKFRARLQKRSERSHKR